jgi:prevent-host-death family protein
MREREIMTQTIKASDARQQWSELLNKVFRKETRVVVEKSGIPVAAIISAEDLERLNRYEQERAERFKILDEIGEAFKDVPPEELEREVAKTLDAVRQENRKKAQQAAQTR